MVGEGDAEADGVGVTLAVADGLPMAYTLKSSAPTYTVPSTPMAAGDCTLVEAPTVRDHTNTPLLPFTAITTPAMFPMYTMKLLDTAGETVVNSLLALYDHSFEPVVPLRAYKLASEEPMNTTSFPVTAGEQSTIPPVVNDHRNMPDAPSRPYTLWSSLPMYTWPLGPTAGDDNT